MIALPMNKQNTGKLQKLQFLEVSLFQKLKFWNRLRFFTQKKPWPDGSAGFVC
jgi:hypothetical protein